MINPWLITCSTCVHYEILDKKALCKLGNFKTSVSEGLLMVPLDFDCIEYEEKPVNGRRNGNDDEGPRQEEH